MPDANLAAQFLATSKTLVETSPEDSGALRRAISTAYYAVFHALARMCADALVGDVEADRPNKAWVEVYRGLDHGKCKNACAGAKNVAFPQELRDFADAFGQLQSIRHQADYDPTFEPNSKEASFYIALADKNISTLNAVKQIDRKAFSAWVLITSQGAVKARQQIKR